jgi:hypothetical protein
MKLDLVLTFMNLYGLVVFSGYSTNKIDRHDITEILLKVALNTINQNLLIPFFNVFVNGPRMKLDLVLTFMNLYEPQ